MLQEKKKLGHILIQKGILTPYTVARMLRVSKYRNKRLGCILEEFGLVTGEELAAVLAQQFNLKQVSNLANNTYSPDVLQVVSVEFALEQILFPLNLEGRTLHLAIADPTDTKVVDNFAKNNGLLIIPYVASRKEIYAAISRHYLGTSIKESRKTTILVVEDDDITRSEMKDILVKQGYHVVMATDGMEGFKEVVASKPHVVVTDNEMPKLDGFALFNSIKAAPETCQIPVVLVSDKLSDEDEAKAFEIGFFDYIPKPFKEVSFITRINRAVSSAELAVASAMVTELPWEKRETADRRDDEPVFSLTEEMLSGFGMSPSVLPDDEQGWSKTVINQEMMRFPESELPPSVTTSVPLATVRPVVEQKPETDTAPFNLETSRATIPSPADFIVAAPVSADTEAKETPSVAQAAARQKMDGTAVSGESNKSAGHESGARPELSPLYSHALPETVPPARTKAPPQAGSSARISQSMPAAKLPGKGFTASDETTVQMDKIIEDTLLAFDQGRRSHSRRIIFMIAVALSVVAGGGYWLMDPLYLRSLYRTESLQLKVAGQTSARTGGVKMTVLPRPVQKPLSDVPKPAATPVRQLPSFVPVSNRDASFSTQRPGWERYVDTRRDVRVFRQSDRIKALQVIVAPGHVITEASVKSALREMTGNGDLVPVSRKRQGEYLLQSLRVGQHADVLLYRKVPADTIVAFVVAFD